MKALPISLGACALVAACVAVSPPDNTFAYRPGTGVVENVREARVAVPSGALAGSSAAAGSYGTPMERATRPRWVEGYQLTLRMDDGTTQAVTQDSVAFHAGDRVQLTSEGRVVKIANPPPAATSSLRPGDGTVVSASAASASAAAGASTQSSSVQQLAIRMDDGTTQVVTLHGGTAQPGERVRITSDGRLVRP